MGPNVNSSARKKSPCVPSNLKTFVIASALASVIVGTWCGALWYCVVIAATASSAARWPAPCPYPMDALNCVSVVEVDVVLRDCVGAAAPRVRHSETGSAVAVDAT